MLAEKICGAMFSENLGSEVLDLFCGDGIRKRFCLLWLN